MSSPTEYRVASSHPEETAVGATFAPGETVSGIDPSDPDDARKIKEGRFVEILKDEKPESPKASSTAKSSDNQEGSK